LERVLKYQERVVDEEYSLETQVPNLYLSIRNLLLEEVYSDINECSPLVMELSKKMRQSLDIYKMQKREPYTRVSGVDAGSQILPLAFKRYAVISSLVYSLPTGSRYFLKPEAFSFPYKMAGHRIQSIVNVRREAKLYETACRFIEENVEVELILVDGPLAFSNWWSTAGKDEDKQRLVYAVNRLLSLCMERGTSVAGIVKRPSARYLLYEMGLQGETDLSDSFLMLHTLRSGERTGVFSPRSAIRKAVRSAPFMDAIDSPVYSFYCRFSKEWSIPPLRIDLPAFVLGDVGEIADFCYGSSYWKGIPMPIVKADEEVRISKRFISEVYHDILGKVIKSRWAITNLAPMWGEGAWLGA
jgi:hypothetical protein